MSDNGSERLARMEEAMTAMASAIKTQSEVTARGLETLVSMHRVLDTRLAILETQVGDVLGELRSHARHIDDVIAEFRGHTHEAA